jgi:hypothetical protein
MTKKQMLDFIAKPMPACNLLELKSALEQIYLPIYYYFENEGDIYEAALAKQVYEDGMFKLSRFNSNLEDFNYENCPDSNLTYFLTGAQP